MMSARPSSVDLQSTCGVVVIGRNEARRLPACLRSLVRTGLPIVYVDSQSTDDSVSIASAAGVPVVELGERDRPSAALARNRGARALVESRPGVEFVLFIDGDCELVEGWLSCAVAVMAGDAHLAAVCGYRHELRPQRNLFHRAVEQEWRMGPVGVVDDFAGDVLVRRSWFERVGGYDTRAVAGEDTELSSRLRACGGRIERLDMVATVHEIDMGNVGQWWRRARRGGYGAAAVAELHYATDRLFADQVRRMLLWGIAVPLAVLLACLRTRALLLVVVARWVMATWRAARAVANPAADRLDRLAWGLSCSSAAVPGAFGVLRFVLDRARGRTPRLIEYR
jgi:GT2 family glycosyltransferase